MNLFKKRPPAPQLASSAPAGVSAGLPRAGDALPQSLKAHSQFIKRVNCKQCGAPKTLPSATAYLYCDYCGALIDYDFRLANAGTNAGITNTVFHRLMAANQVPLAQAQARGDREAYRRLYRQIYAQWIQECPMAVSPRAKTDVTFRDQLVAYLAECVVAKDLDPQQAPLNARMAALEASLQRIPVAGGAWRVAGPFWAYAELFKQLMEGTYAMLERTGVSAMDPDHPPPGVAVHMEYSTFCQGWLPHLAPQEGEKLLALFGLTADYDEAKPQATTPRQCGSCGATLPTLAGARQVVCESCGRTLDIAGGAVPCRGCGVPLSFPISVGQVQCPYCHTETRRV